MLPPECMTPDFDEPMELVESRRLHYLEGLERALLAGPRKCPHCHQPMEASTPAAPLAYDASADRGPVPAKDANIAQEGKPSGWRDRPPLA